MNRIIKLTKMLALSLCLIVFAFSIKKMIDRPEEESTCDSGGKYDFAMGTVLSGTVYGEDDEKILDEIFAYVKHMDEDIFSWRIDGSLISKLNRDNQMSFGNPDADSEKLFEALMVSYGICKESDGALDITMRPLLDLWGIEEVNDDFVIPSDSEITQALDNVGYEKIVIDDEKISIPDGVILDMGSTVKGYALDEVYRILEERGVEGAIVSIGGGVIVYGDKPSGIWRVGVRDPKGTQDDFIGYIELPKGTRVCISTSGDYEKYVEYEGKRYHHIMDRKTGKPAESGVSSVTVLCYFDKTEHAGLVSDGLSTACFVLGYEKSQPLLQKYNAEAIFIDSEGNIKMTDGIKELFHKN